MLMTWSIIFWCMTLLPSQRSTQIVMSYQHDSLLRKWLLWFQASCNPCLNLSAGIRRQENASRHSRLASQNRSATLSSRIIYLLYLFVCYILLDCDWVWNHRTHHHIFRLFVLLARLLGIETWVQSQRIWELQTAQGQLKVSLVYKDCAVNKSHTSQMQLIGNDGLCMVSFTVGIQFCRC